MYPVFIILAALGFITMIVGIFLVRKRFTWTRLDGTYRYRTSDNTASENGTQIKHREIGIQKMKGVAGTFSITYKIPDFYQKLKSGDNFTRRFALLFFGAVVFVLSTFLAIGAALVEGGNPNGWLFIGIVVFVVIISAVLHIRAVRQSNRSDQDIPSDSSIN